MLISTRGRYALRVMIDLAENQENEKIPLKEIAERQEISLKYIERIMPSLVKAGFVEGVHGKGGGYRLVKNPSEYKVGNILRVTEGGIAPVACLKEGADPCPRAPFCKTLPMWKGLQENVNSYLDGLTLEDLIQVSDFI